MSGERVQRISCWLRRRADSRAGAVALFGWAFAEALVWPVIPDASLALLVASRPRRWPVLLAATLAGSVVGGLVGWAASSAGWSWPLPLTTPRMQAAAVGWLAEGPAGLAHQPMSGVPYKVFVAAAPETGLSAGELAVATVRYRGARFAVTAVATAAAAAVAWRVVPPGWRVRAHVGVSAVATALLLAGLGLVVRSWS